uniref:Reverse transcriptase zinc-binding domain-containing protein n=1 Tax=Chenopodium quinoa TaxID=63459 RepID=A0A803N7D5_CHEQI
MAVKDRLRYRHITTDATYQLCGVNETIYHTLFECVVAKEIWHYSEYKTNLEDAPNDNFAELWLWLCKKYDAEVVCSMAALMWAAWRGRNLIMFQGENPNSVLLAAGFARIVHDYNGYAKKVLLPPSVLRQNDAATSWKKPCLGCVKANSDAHILEGCKTRLGVVVYF